ncbi:MAG: hypothetical protein LBC10_01430 [Deltaproteobacteria bacterium]|nr:hypothetical protein [Deltaproteobacteria bacterium]
MSHGERLTIFRITPQTQIVDLINAGAFNPEVLEHDGFDRAVMMIQELGEKVDRSLKVSLSSGQTGDALMDAIHAAGAEARASADEAASSAQDAADSANLANEARAGAEQAAIGAGKARDVAIRQTEAVNLLMETELGKINTIVAVNQDDQQAAVEMARKWAEADGPVQQDADGTTHRSAKHWAGLAQEAAGGLAIPAIGADPAPGVPGLVYPDGESIVMTAEGMLTATNAWSVELAQLIEAMAGKLDASAFNQWVSDTEPMRVKAWANVTSNGAILRSFGISSVTRTNTGIYRITLSKPAPNTYYGVFATSNTWFAFTEYTGMTARTTTAFDLATYSSAPGFSDYGFTVAVLY